MGLPQVRPGPKLVRNTADTGTGLHPAPRSSKMLPRAVPLTAETHPRRIQRMATSDKPSTNKPTARQESTGMAFERPIQDLESKLAELESLALRTRLDISSEIEALRKQHRAAIEATYKDLTAWETVTVARHA